MGNIIEVFYINSVIKNISPEIGWCGKFQCRDKLIQALFYRINKVLKLVIPFNPHIEIVGIKYQLHC